MEEDEDEYETECERDKTTDEADHAGCVDGTMKIVTWKERMKGQNKQKKRSKSGWREKW